jgi:hypothetical protein
VLRVTKSDGKLGLRKPPVSGYLGPNGRYMEGSCPALVPYEPVGSTYGLEMQTLERLYR